MRTRMAAGLVFALSVSGCGFTDYISRSDAYNYVTVTHASTHLNARKDFNENNPGIGFGSEAPIRRGPNSVGVEAGRFLNSVDKYTSYAAGYWERDLLPQSNPRRVRAGAFFAYAEYPDEVQRAKDNGYLTLGDFVPIVGLQATVATVSQHEFRFRLTPGLSQSDGIVTLQSNWRF